MFAAARRSRIGKWALVGVLVVVILLLVVVVTGVVLGAAPAEHDGVADLRALPRFGEMVRKVDRAVRYRVDDPAKPDTQSDAQADAQSDAQPDPADPDPVAEPPAPKVNRLAFPTEPTPEANAEWLAAGRKSIVQLQRYRSVEAVAVGALTAPNAEVVVTDLSPRNGISYLAEIRPVAGSTARGGGPWQLQNADPAGQLLHPTADGLLLVNDRSEEECMLWPGGDPSLLEAAAQQGRDLGAAWIPLCGKPARVFLRLPVSGRKTRKEWTTDFLRDNLPAGEQMTVLVRKTLFADSELRTGVLEGRTEGVLRLPGAPLRVAIDPRWSDLTTLVGDLGLAVEESTGGRLPVGRWLPLKDQREGVWVSLFQPRLVNDQEVHDPRIQPLDEVELSSMVYLVAFDLADHDLSFALGTDHPRLVWSERVPENVGDRRKPGPDGFDDGAPLARAGQVPPWRLAELQATFTGGFKRSHGAFKRGDLSRSHDGSHYGFVEDGVVWSKPVPGLATVTIWDEGGVELHTWTEQDDDRLARVRHLRQNGVPLLAPETVGDGSEIDAASVRVGPLVGRWGDGNWSGSQDQKLRSVRAGLCITEDDRHLIYGWFSAGTPSGMAKVFLAYRCRYAMLLDMNALEHTYLSILTPTTEDRPIPAGSLRVEHLVRGMEVLDEAQGSVILPRFAGFADNRDFFYLTRKQRPEPARGETGQ